MKKLISLVFVVDTIRKDEEYEIIKNSREYLESRFNIQDIDYHVKNIERGNRK